HSEGFVRQAPQDALEERRADGTALTGTLDHKQTMVDGAGLGDELDCRINTARHSHARDWVLGRVDREQWSAAVCLDSESPMARARKRRLPVDSAPFLSRALNHQTAQQVSG